MRRFLPLFFLFLLPATAHADCKCLFDGGEVKEGELACIKTADGPKLARCGKSQNVTSWVVTEDDCEIKQSLQMSLVKPRAG
jgi:hypothetical protein